MRAAACPALLIAASASGQGKTTVTAALARYHAGQGRQVRVFKAGPDFIDPTLLEVASGHPVYQLDLWMVGEVESRCLLHKAAQTADLILIEGVMGLFDGAPSAADLAERLGVPVMVLIDAHGMAETFAALALGLATYRSGLNLYGVAANRVGSSSHSERLRHSLPNHIPFRGAFPRQREAIFPSRHLGLVQAFDLEGIQTQLDSLAALIPGTGLEALPPPVEFQTAASAPLVPLLRGVRIGIARDEAFSFIYPANIDLLREMGAELVCFSPLRDTSIPDVDSLYLPGGYPELHLAELSANAGMLASIREHAGEGKPILAECGGMLYLTDSLTDAEGHKAPVCGLLSGYAVMQNKLSGLGMQSADFVSGTLRGHTFHYSRLETSLSPSLKAARRAGGEGEAIYQTGRITASYLHGYFPSSPAVVAELLLP